MIPSSTPLTPTGKSGTMSSEGSISVSRPSTLVGTPRVVPEQLPGTDSIKDTPEKTEANTTEMKDEYIPSSTRPTFSPLRRYCLLVMFCLAQYLDVFNNSSLLTAIPVISKELGMSTDESVWIVSALQLSFAAFLLVSGRISDVYSPKSAFIVGLFVIGFINLGIGFVRNKIVMFILRGVTGVFGAMTIPSALNLIVKLFPEPAEQSRAIAAFGATGAIANITGYVLGAVFVQYVNWQWVFYFATCVALPLAVASIPLIPSDQEMRRQSHHFHDEQKTLKGLDIIGVSLLTAALILLIFGLTSGSADGWSSARVLAPLIISVFLIAGFLYYETLIPEENAVVPPSTWFYPNFSVLFGAALLPYLWWVTLFIIYTEYWDGVFGWSPIKTAVHVLPLGLAGFLMATTGPLAQKINSKWLILFGQVMSLAATILLPFSGPKNRYWSFVFPAFTIGSAGNMLSYVHTNIAIFASSPPQKAGTVGAIFNSALQVGSAIGIAAVTSIQTSVQNKSGPKGVLEFEGRAASLWFLVGIVALECVCMLIFYDSRKSISVTPSTKQATVDDQEPSEDRV